MKCIDCGLLDKGKDVYNCVRFNKKLVETAVNEEQDCQYYKEIIYEEREPLSPQQHLNMQDGEQRSRKMRGPL